MPNIEHRIDHYTINYHLFDRVYWSRTGKVSPEHVEIGTVRVTERWTPSQSGNMFVCRESVSCSSLPPTAPSFKIILFCSTRLKTTCSSMVYAFCSHTKMVRLCKPSHMTHVISIHSFICFRFVLCFNCFSSFISYL